MILSCLVNKNLKIISNFKAAYQFILKLVMNMIEKLSYLFYINILCYLITVITTPKIRNDFSYCKIKKK